MLFFQQVEVVYAVVALLLTVGVLFWLFGSRFHRLFLTVLFLSVGIVGGWEVANAYAVNVFLGMTIGVALGASLGYWLFRFWLGLFASGLVGLALLIVYWYAWAQPCLAQAARQTQVARVSQGIELNPPATQRATGGISATTEPASASTGQAYRNLEVLLPKLAPRAYADWDGWRAGFPETASSILRNLSVIMPRLRFELTIILMAALIVAMLAAFLRPYFLNIVYTSATGSLLVALSVAALLTLKATVQTQWLSVNSWVVWTGLAVMTGVGIGVQYYLYPPAKPEEPQEEEDEEAPTPPKGGKSKGR
ncbi:MAG: hypothetical protein GXY33_16390 [Phycisphaerae bacterium]|nr:hypothetical protein [Phycisphaerae bacterium]